METDSPTENITTTTATKVMMSFDASKFVSAIVFLIAYTGFLANLSVLLFSGTVKTLRTSFGSLLASQAFAEGILSAMFAFFYCPMVFFNIEFMKTASAKAGLLLLYCYDVCIFSHLFIAANRLCAISLPVHYDYIFSSRTTRILIFSAYAFASFTSIYMHLANNCLLPYVEFGWYFGVNTSEDCDTIRFFVDFCKDFVIVSIISAINVLTVIRISASSFRTRQIAASVSHRRSMEVKFAKQVILQGVVFATELVLFFIVSVRQTSPWMIFACTTVAWSSVHAIDPLIIVVMNSELRQNMFRIPQRFKTKPISGVTSGQHAYANNIDVELSGSRTNQRRSTALEPSPN